MRNMRYKEGDIIRYNAFGGLSRNVLVEEKDDDIKNGRPGFSGVHLDPDLKPYPEKDGMGVWGYDAQIVQVVKRA